MKKIFFFPFAGIFFLSLSIQAQQKCSTDEVIRYHADRIDGYQEAVYKAFDDAKAYAEKHNLAAKANEAPDTIYRIPVVVHVIWNIAEQNLDDSIVHSQIEVLNEDFRRRNADTNRTRAEFLDVAGDAGIEFYLAETDPQGNPTNGITRTQTATTGFSVGGFGGGMDDMKASSTGGADGWPPNDYLNIWVCNMDGGFLGQVLGFAYPPAGAPNWPANSSASQPEFDGVALHYQAFGRNNPYGQIDMGGQLINFDKGRSATHEVGHYLGIRHIWGDAFFDGCNQDDGIDDTPLQAAQSQFNCNRNLNSCTDSPVDLPDMVENFMDYSDENCQNMFTAGQISIMRAMLATARAGLADTGDTTTTQPPVGIADIDGTIDVRLYPNPANTVLNVEIPALSGQIEINLSDASGRVISTHVASQRDTRIDVSQLDSGVYLLSSNHDGVTFRKTFIKN